MQNGLEPQLGGERRRKRLRYDIQRTSTARMRQAQERLVRGQRTEAMHVLAGILLDDPDHASAQELLDIIQRVEADRTPLWVIVQMLLTMLAVVTVMALPTGYLLVKGAAILPAITVGVPLSIGLGVVLLLATSGLRSAFERSRSNVGGPGCLIVGVPIFALIIVGAVGLTGYLLTRLAP